jgi:hypothetical protein
MPRMNTSTYCVSSAAKSRSLTSLAFPLLRREPLGEEFPDLAPGLVMSTFRSARLWGGMGWRRAFPGRGDQSALARRMVGQLLADTACVDDAVWVTAELVSNALRHTDSGRERGFFVVEVLLGAEVARIVVYDLGGGGPVSDFSQTLGALPETAENGRGLAGVAELAVRAGAAGDEVSGHAVWVDLALTGEAAGSSDGGEQAASAQGLEAARGGLGQPVDAGPAAACRDVVPVRQEEGVRLDPPVLLREAS